MFKKILHPTDFSPVALQAFEQAVGLAKRCGAQLRVVHAIVLHGYDPARIRKGRKLLDQAYEAVEADLSDGMKDIVGKVPHVSVEPVFKRGFAPADVILEEAQRWGADLIVMGVHGGGAVRRLFLGSVADRVVRYAACPVMLSGGGKPVSGPFKRILLPLDFSEASRPVAELALRLARQDGAEVHLLHVVHDVMPPSFYAAGDAFKWDPGLRDRCRGAMEEFLTDLEPQGLTVHKLVEEGRVSQVIVEVARREDVDLIVMGTHGRSGVSQILLGSATDRVLRNAPCPVMAVGSGAE